MHKTKVTCTCQLTLGSISSCLGQNNFKIINLFYKRSQEHQTNFQILSCGHDLPILLDFSVHSLLSWRFTGQLEAGMFGFRIICFWNRVYPCFFSKSMEYSISLCTYLFFRLLGQQLFQQPFSKI